VYFAFAKRFVFNHRKKEPLKLKVKILVRESLKTFLELIRKRKNSQKQRKQSKNRFQNVKRKDRAMCQVFLIQEITISRSVAMILTAVPFRRFNLGISKKVRLLILVGS
jgi:hypothetical protein